MAATPTSRCWRIKPGFADVQETVTCVARLKCLLDALHASRQNMRDAELVELAFPDTSGRFGVIRQGKGIGHLVSRAQATPGPISA